MAARETELESVVALGDGQIETAIDSIAADADAAVLTVDRETYLESAIGDGVQSAPTFVPFVDGRPVKQLRGAQDEGKRLDLLGRYGE